MTFTYNCLYAHGLKNIIKCLVGHSAEVPCELCRRDGHGSALLLLCTFACSESGGSSDHSHLLSRGIPANCEGGI